MPGRRGALALPGRGPAPRKRVRARSCPLFFFIIIILNAPAHPPAIPMPEIVYEIVEQIAVLSESSKGWTKELNLISWNERDPKYDIREWSPDHAKMGKGVTLSPEEAAILKKALDTRDL